MQEFIINFMNDFGYIGIMFLIAIENIFPPIPSEIILTFGGFMTTYTKLNAIWVIVASTVGAIIGAVVLYYIGKILNKERLNKIVDSRLGKILRLKRKDIESSNSWFEKKGPKAVFFGRCIPIIRSLISIPAGMSEMPFGKFLTYTTLGSLIWNIVLVYLGVFMGAKWEVVADVIDKYSKIVLIILVVVIVVGAIVFYRSRSNKNKK